MPCPERRGRAHRAASTPRPAAPAARRDVGDAGREPRLRQRGVPPSRRAASRLSQAPPSLPCHRAASDHAGDGRAPAAPPSTRRDGDARRKRARPAARPSCGVRLLPVSVQSTARSAVPCVCFAPAHARRRPARARDVCVCVCANAKAHGPRPGAPVRTTRRQGTWTGKAVRRAPKAGPARARSRRHARLTPLSQRARAAREARSGAASGAGGAACVSVECRQRSAACGRRRRAPSASLRGWRARRLACGRLRCSSTPLPRAADHRRRRGRRPHGGTAARVHADGCAQAAAPFVVATLGLQRIRPEERARGLGLDRARGPLRWSCVLAGREASRRRRKRLASRAPGGRARHGAPPTTVTAIAERRRRRRRRRHPRISPKPPSRRRRRPNGRGPWRPSPPRASVTLVAAPPLSPPRPLAAAAPTRLRGPPNSR